MDAMATLTMDTHRIVKRLKDAGFTDPQAETVTDILAETRASDLADVATKADIAALEADIAALRTATGADIAALRTATGADIAALRTEIKADIAAAEARIVKWLVPLLLGQTGLTVALIKLLS